MFIEEMAFHGFVVASWLMDVTQIGIDGTEG